MLVLPILCQKETVDELTQSQTHMFFNSEMSSVSWSFIFYVQCELGFQLFSGTLNRKVFESRLLLRFHVLLPRSPHSLIHDSVFNLSRLQSSGCTSCRPVFSGFWSCYSIKVLLIPYFWGTVCGVVCLAGFVEFWVRGLLPDAVFMDRIAFPGNEPQYLFHRGWIRVKVHR